MLMFTVITALMSPVTPGGEVLTRELVYYSNEVNCQAYAEKEATKQRKLHAQILAKTGGKIVGVCSEKKVPKPAEPSPPHTSPEPPKQD